MYNTDNIMKALEEYHHLSPEFLAAARPNILSICSTINKDVRSGIMREFSHNIISIDLRKIAENYDNQIANSVIRFIPMIELTYEICESEDVS